MTENKRFTYLDASRNKYIGSFFCNGIPLTNQEVADFLNENGQLKKENYELHKRLGDFEPFERYMKERTSKTSVNDIIGLVKTDEQTNSVELKKELYK